MRVLLIAALAWTATASAFDIPANATHEVENCTIVTDGRIYSSNSQDLGVVVPEAKYDRDRYTWKDGDVEYVATRGKRSGDGDAVLETFMQRTVERQGDVEHEALQITVNTKSAGTTDSSFTYEVNEYKVSGETKTLQSRTVNAQPVNVNEAVNDHPTPTGRVLSTTIKGPYSQKLSDVTGQYATIQSQVKTCTSYRVGQS